MRIPLAIAACALAAIVAFADDDDGRGKFKGRLSGFQEVPAIVTTGTGEVEVEVIESPKSLRVTLAYSGLEGAAQAAHLHIGQRGVNGAVAAFLCGGGGKPACPAAATDLTVTIGVSDVVAIPAQGLNAGNIDGLIKALESGAVYANVHTTKHAGGEIRAQLGRARGAGRGRGHGEGQGQGQGEGQGHGQGRGNH
ncbi:MAG: CHRD domain-containing protein [Acidobacteria bacterium]|nr:CHRD domain-containing protein [Acidobacteriota bacterium]